MNAKRERFETLFAQALSCEPDHRATFLAGAYGDDTGLLEQPPSYPNSDPHS